MSSALVNFGRNPYAPTEEPYNLPIELVEEDLWGDCRIQVSNADVSGQHTRGPQLVVPDRFRAMASWIINQCVIPKGWGGFGTVSLQAYIDWVANDTISNADLANGAFMGNPDNPLYIVEVTTNTLKVYEPAFYDPAVGEALADGVSQRGNHARGEMIALQAESMGRGKHIEWWESFAAAGSGYRSEMIYACDSNLGSPTSADCSQLEYSSLGPPSDTVMIGPGSAAKVLSVDSCNVGITASPAMSVTWAQIQAGLDALINICVTHPLMKARGGSAHADTNPSTALKGVGSKKRNIRLSGLNALPFGVNITLFATDLPESDDPAMGLIPCVWLQAVGASRDTNICPQGH